MLHENTGTAAPFELPSLLHSGYQHPVTRAWQCGGTRVTREALLFPIFVHDRPNDMVEIASMPGQYR
jgi:porphobilinogen synthase